MAHTLLTDPMDLMDLTALMDLTVLTVHMVHTKNILREIDGEFPILINDRNLIYLDNACSALKFNSSINAQRKILAEYGSCAGERSVHLLALKTEEAYKKSRTSISQIINSKPQEIVFTSGTTEAFNILANSFKFKENDEIIISGLEHNSVFLPFYKISKRLNLKLKIIPIKNYNPDFNEFKKLINKKTKVLCISKASNIFGGIVETQDITNYAKERDIKVFTDLAQYAPTHKIDVKKLNIDAGAFSGHKIGAPYGTGVLYIKEDLYKHLDSSKVGGGTIKEAKNVNGEIKVDFLEGYKGFEAGIQNYAGAYALSVAYEKLNEIGFAKIRKYISSLVKYAKDNLSNIKGVKIIGTGLEEGSIISFTTEKPGFSHPDFSIFVSNYKNKKIAVRHGRVCADLACINSKINSVIRISFFIYNTRKDIDIFCQALEDYKSTIDS